MPIRSRPSKNKRLTIRDFAKRQKDIDRDLYRKIAVAVLSRATENIIQQGEQIEMPQGLGTFCVERFKLKAGRHKIVDFKATREAGKTIFHRNLHSQRYIAKWKWKKGHRVRGIVVYNFKATRTNTRELARSIIEDNTITLYRQ